MEEEKQIGWFRRFLSMLSPSDIIGFLGAVIGAGVTIASVVKDQSIQIICIVVSQILLLLAWLCALRFRYSSALKIGDKEKSIETLKKRISETNTEYERKAVQLEKDREHMIKQLFTISMAVKNNNTNSNEILVKIPMENESQYDFLRTLKELKNESNGEAYQENMREEIEKSARKFADQLYEVFNNFCSKTTGESQKLENAYLDLKRIPLTVSITVKLMNKPYHSDGNDNIERIKVYTAYRDYEAYSKHEREVGEEVYTVRGNTAFITCITKDYFISNNLKREQENYSNEHKGFEEFYNCVIVVPIKLKRADGQVKFFGFLCCDCLNNDTTLTEIFDKSAAQYLFAFAQSMATFLETLDANWVDRFGEMNYVSHSVLEMLYKKVLKMDKKAGDQE